MLWLGAVALDALFGGRKALGAIPSLDTLSQALFSGLRQRLERMARGRHALFWRGLLVQIVLVGLLYTVGSLIDRFAFSHAAFIALSTAVLARYLNLKILFQTTSELAGQPDSSSRRKAIEHAVHYFCSYYTPAMVLFLLGGFSLLAPFYLLHWATSGHGDEKPSAYLKSFKAARNLAALIGESLSAMFLVLGTVLWPKTHVLQAFKGWLVCSTMPKQWGPSIVAHAFGASLRSMWPGKPKWLGSEIGTADINAATSRNALIVALVAFAASLAFLLVLVAGALLGQGQP